MKATAMSIEHSDTETPADDMPLGDVTKRQEFIDAIARAKSRDPAQAASMAETSCFIVTWKDQMGVCPERYCALRVQCQTGYEDALHQISLARPVAATADVVEVGATVLHTDASSVAPASKKSNKKHIVVPQVPQPKPKVAKPKAQQQPAKPKRPRKKMHEIQRGRWKGTGKFKRLGYQPLNRPVDQALAVFLDALGQPKRLPTVWSPNDYAIKFGHLGRLVVSQTASYTSVIADGATVCRFWVNAGGCALIDIVDDLVNVVKTIPGITLVEPVPAGSAKKHSPCTHRFELAFGAGTPIAVLQTLANYIRMAYRG